DAAAAIGDEGSCRQIAEVARDHPDAMTVMAAEIRLHEMVGDDLGLRFRAAGSPEDADGVRTQRLVGDAHEEPWIWPAILGSARADATGSSPASGDPAAVGGEKRLPPFAVAAHKDAVRKAVTRHVLLRDAVPALMLDRDPRLLAYGLEADLDLGRLV